MLALVINLCIESYFLLQVMESQKFQGFSNPPPLDCVYKMLM